MFCSVVGFTLAISGGYTAISVHNGNTDDLERLAIDWSLPPKLVTSATLAQFPSPALVLAVTQMLYAVFGDSLSRV